MSRFTPITFARLAVVAVALGAALCMGGTAWAAPGGNGHGYGPGNGQGNGQGNGRPTTSAPTAPTAPTVPTVPTAPTTGANGANGQCPGGPYCATGTGAPSGNGSGNGKAVGKPCAGCVGKADNKNPKGQLPGGSDGNNGYECDGNHGIGRTNPAHTGCTSAPVTPTPPGSTPPISTPPISTPPVTPTVVPPASTSHGVEPATAVRTLDPQPAVHHATSLAFTGADLSRDLGVGGLLLGAGLGMIALGRRRTGAAHR